ncbi:hypothetical protein [Rothia nasimurium]|uniref:hypothetical protein n=1 Tax=Rothia nasimurium TaxID=85336 RepID=UPI001F181E79|nr:hypothetical protein [Rothia nasimurium]
MGIFSRKKKQAELTTPAAAPAPQAAEVAPILGTDSAAVPAEQVTDTAVAESPAVSNDRDVLAPALATESLPVAGTEEARPELGAGLRSVVALMRSKGEGQVTLNLVQEGNDMDYTLQVRGQQVESGRINPGGEWFDVVADLYVEEKESPRGVFTRALIVVSPDVSGNSSVTASFLNTETGKTSNMNYGLATGAGAGVGAGAVTGNEASAVDANPVGAETSHGLPASAHSAPGSTASPTDLPEETGADSAHSPQEAGEADLPADGEKAQVADEARNTTGSTEADTTGAADLETASSGAAIAATSSEPAAATDLAEDAGSDELADTADAAGFATATGSAGSANTADADTGAASTESLDGDEASATPETLAGSSSESFVGDSATTPEGAVVASAAAQQPATANPTHQRNDNELPAHIDDSTFITEDHADQGAGEPLNTQPVASTHVPAHAADSPADTASENYVPAHSATQANLDAPTTGLTYDVAPSFASTAPTKPSATEKAAGNLVLTEADVVARFAPAYEALFGPNGTARDVSTVLIRVRALGSYYDALTHVRRNGFWEQVRTFDLIPEETLAILQLKADSYKEGHGSPLAMTIRFTPGTPVETAFDYDNEEAFVRYPERLPAQQYVEELRMFPRTGDKIPAHLNEALASWTY